MQFGLWFEPEMVNPDSDLYRAHPDWILATAGRVPPDERGQQVLDLNRPGAHAHVLEQMTKTRGEHAPATVTGAGLADLGLPAPPLATQTVVLLHLS